MPEELTKDEARAMLPDGEQIHTFRQNVGRQMNLLVGADISRESILSKIERYPCLASGPGATAMKHGLCIKDIADSPLFVETRADEQDEQEEEDTDGSQE